MALEALTLVTGVAGFIGSFVAERLLRAGQSVIGLDNLNDYYDPQLKKARVERLNGLFPSDARFEFIRADISKVDALNEALRNRRIGNVVHLAAQAGVRFSIDHPQAFTESNLVGFANILEICRNQKVKHLVYASSSSVYGNTQKVPFSVHDPLGHPVSYYAATKRANELMAHSYSHLFGLPTTGLRLFTVYGPWGRPDMAVFSFTKSILEGEPIKIFNNGQLKRDFTYVDDVAECIVRVLGHVATPNESWRSASCDPATSAAPFRLFNIGNNQPIPLMYFVEELEQVLGKKAIKEFLPMQYGDVVETFADTSNLTEIIGYRPSTSFEVGIREFVKWYRQYYLSAQK